MNLLFRPLARNRILSLALIVALACTACNRGRRKGEPAYVSANQVNLRDRVALDYKKIGQANNAERVEILDRDRRFALVRTAAGVEGWVEQRYLVTQKVYDSFQQLTRDHQDTPAQGKAQTRNETNLHNEPGRDTEHLYQEEEGATLSILQRATVEKRLPGVPSRSGDRTPKAAPMEDWWLVRNDQGNVGWVLARMVDVDVPLEIAQYAEGQRIVAAFVLNEVSDEDKKVRQYLMLLNEPKDGMPYDYNQIRVFTWNVKRHRYETAYRERSLNGVLPVTVGKENFDKEGELPVFVLRVRDDAGISSERKYKMNTPIVRRVVVAGATDSKKR